MWTVIQWSRCRSNVWVCVNASCYIPLSSCHFYTGHLSWLLLLKSQLPESRATQPTNEISNVARTCRENCQGIVLSLTDMGYSLCTHCTDRCVGQAGTGYSTSATQWLVIHTLYRQVCGTGWDRVQYQCYMAMFYTQRCARIEGILTTHHWFVLDRKLIKHTYSLTVHNKPLQCI